MNESGEFAQARGRFNERLDSLPRRYIHSRGRHVKTGIAEEFRGRACILRARVGKYDVLASTNAPRNGLGYLTCDQGRVI
jgi:hypothetical protein